MSWNVVGGKQWHAPNEIPFHQQNIFLCQSNFVEIIRLSQSSGKSGHPSVLGILPDLRQLCLSVCLRLISFI